MAIINKTGIGEGNLIEAEHVTRAIDALSGVGTDTIIATGSFTGSFIGNLTGQANSAISASFAITASYALNAVGSGTEYMTLRLSSGVITGVTSGSAIYIGTATTSSNVESAGVSLPFDCQIVSASVYLNSPVLTNCLLSNGALNYAIDATPIKIANLSNLDPKTVFIDSKAHAIGYDGGTADRWINVSYIPNATATGRFILSADILIKKV